MFNFDHQLTHWINSWAGLSPVLDVVFIWVSMIGVPVLVAAVAGQWWLRQDRPHTRHILLAAGFAFLLGLAVNQLILLLVQRVRPYDAGFTNLIIARSNDPSFPSDHATAAFAIAATFLIHGLRGRGLAFLAAATLVALSRIYIGTHYASDVVGGAVIGIFAALLICKLYAEGSRVDRLLTAIF